MNNATRKPIVHAFFDNDTHTVSYIVADPSTHKAAVVDSVLDYEPHGASLAYTSADKLIACIDREQYTIEWILETHVHADHLTAAQYLKGKLGGRIGIGAHITDVQQTFAPVFHGGRDFKVDGTQFDRLFEEGDLFSIGNLTVKVLHTPGHTPADVSYLIGDAVFVGDTLFMPDYGTARVDFPGGNAQAMYESAHKLFALPDNTRMFLCHDYLPNDREVFAWETTVGAQKVSNVHLNAATTVEEFSTMREEKDSALGMPRLIIPSIQVNMQAGLMPKNETTGRVLFTIPVDSVFAKK